MTFNSLNDRLLIAVKEKRLDLVNACIKTSSLSTVDWAGNSALHLAVVNNDIEIVKLLISYGANVNMHNKFKKTPLHLACQAGNEIIANLLIENGSDINARDMLRMTPLLWCVERNHENLVILLCGKDGLDLNAVDKFNRTCFDINVKNNNDFINRILLNTKTNMSNKPIEQEKEQTIKKSLNHIILEEEEDDDDEDDDLFSFNETKKKRFSFSPIQNAEETLFWLKKQAMSNSNDYLLDENCELSLTEAGILTLEYLNKNDPIGDEQRLLIRLAKQIEDEEKKETGSNSEMIIDTNDDLGDNLDDWFIDSLNFDNDKNEFF